MQKEATEKLCENQREAGGIALRFLSISRGSCHQYRDWERDENYIHLASERWTWSKHSKQRVSQKRSQR